MLVTNETAVLNARSGRTPRRFAGFSGSAPCSALEGVEHERRDEREREHGARVLAPAHVVLGVDAQSAVDGALDRPQPREGASGPTVVDPLQVDREHRRGGHQAAEQDDEQDRGGHQKRSGRSSATTK